MAGIACRVHVALRKLPIKYRKIASSNTSLFEAQVRYFKPEAGPPGQERQARSGHGLDFGVQYALILNNFG